MVTRSNEQKKLEKIYSENSNQLVLVYGARGCLKEDFISTFCKGKNAFFYKCRNVSPEKQLQAFASDIKNNLKAKSSIDSYDDCFKTISGIITGKKILVIDDFEYIVKKDDSFIKTLAKYKNQMFIILCSSSLSWINNDLDDLFSGEKDVIDARLKLDEVGFLDVVRAFPKYSVAESVTVYGILGGVPSYLNRWNQSKSFKQNVCDNILDVNGFLFNEANEFLGSELRELTVYNTILSSIKTYLFT